MRKFACFIEEQGLQHVRSVGELTNHSLFGEKSTQLVSFRDSLFNLRPRLDLAAHHFTQTSTVLLWLAACMCVCRSGGIRSFSLELRSYSESGSGPAAYLHLSRKKYECGSHAISAGSQKVLRTRRDRAIGFVAVVSRPRASSRVAIRVAERAFCFFALD
jgi:hypothetical protein